MTRAVKWIIVANVVAFVLRLLVRNLGQGPFDELFGLFPQLITTRWMLWQFVTYMFVHAGPFHILFNMLVLWMFGCDLERYWGPEKFLKYYFLTGIGAGFCSYIIAPRAVTVTVGASGAIFGVLLAYGILFADRIIYMYFLFPIKAKYFVMVMGALEFYAALTSTGSGISNTAHLGGMLVGFLYLKRGAWFWGVREWRDRWKLNRARRKFKIYLKQQEEEKPHSHDDDRPMMIQ